MRIIWQAAFAAAAILWPVEVTAATACVPLKQLNQMQLHFDEKAGREMIPVSINGAPKDFVFSLAQPVTAISHVAADALKLPLIEDNKFTVVSKDGSRTREGASVATLDFGNLKVSNMTFPVITSLVDYSDGIFGLDLINRFDIDLDFATDTLRLFSADHCEGGVLYWQAPVTGVVPIEILSSSQFSVQVNLDGHLIDALVSTSTPQTIMTQDVAEYLYGLKMGAPGVEQTDDLNGEDVYLHRFDNLALGDVQVKNAQIRITRDPFKRVGDRRQYTGSRAIVYRDFRMAPLIIGLNTLRKLHVYIAFREKRMYVSPASATGASAAALPSASLPSMAATQ